jgi:peroxiredoxin
MLHVGDRAPDFCAATTLGREIALNELRGRTVVLFFFHKAFTPNCMIETRGFRAGYEGLQKQGVEVVGISTDSFAVQCSFAAAMGATFPMIGDREHTIARAYDVLWGPLPIARRVTYVVDAGGRVHAVFHHDFRVWAHLDQVFASVRMLAPTRATLPSPS